MKKNLFFLFLIFSYSLTCGQVFNINNNKIEFIGLKKWNPKAFLDSMINLHPGKSLHACAGLMKHDFGFAEVSNFAYPMENHSFYFLVTIIEDNLQGKIVYLPKPTDSLELLTEYAKYSKLFENNPMILIVGIDSYDLYKKGKIDSAKILVQQYRIDPKPLMPFWDFLSRHKDRTDQNLALWVLNNDSNMDNRRIAISILSNFNSQENVWWTLMNLQRDKDKTFASVATEMLRNFIKEPIVVDWSPALPCVRYILSGTNLWAFTNTLEVMEKTGFPQKLAPQLLTGASDLLIDYLHAEHQPTRESAINFVNYLSNNNLKDSEECEKWLNQYKGYAE